jgi:hypothetical protein
MGNGYKDSLFRSIFNNEAALRSVYNALTGANYDESAVITINTLVETLFTSARNDVSFVINDNLVLLLEQQASENRNMPFRMLGPIVRLFENGIEDKSAIYRRKLIPLPRPEFIVLYNGTEPFPERSELRLSDAFEKVAGNDRIDLELVVTVYNINKGQNAELLAKDKNLGGYAEFVALVREFQKDVKREEANLERDAVLHKAITRAVSYCKEHDILRSFFEGLTNEEVFMLTREWNLEDAKKVWREEALEEGEARGVKIGVKIGEERGEQRGEVRGQELVLNLMEQGYSVEEIKRQLNRPSEQSSNTYR